MIVKNISVITLSFYGQKPFSKFGIHAHVCQLTFYDEQLFCLVKDDSIRNTFSPIVAFHKKIVYRLHLHNNICSRSVLFIFLDLLSGFRLLFCSYCPWTTWTSYKNSLKQGLRYYIYSQLCYEKSMEYSKLGSCFSFNFV